MFILGFPIALKHTLTPAFSLFQYTITIVLKRLIESENITPRIDLIDTVSPTAAYRCKFSAQQVVLLPLFILRHKVRNVLTIL